MSTILVVKKAGQAVIAADSISKFGSTKVAAPCRMPYDKILCCGESYIGVVGASAHHNVMASIIRNYGEHLSFNSVDDAFETYRRLHPILQQEYYLRTYEREDDDYESSQINALIANPHGIFGIYSWREAFEYESFWALGSGFEYALGAMHAVYDQMDEPQAIAEAGMVAACAFDDSSGLPFSMHSVMLSDAPPAEIKAPSQSAGKTKGKRKKS